MTDFISYLSPGYYLKVQYGNYIFIEKANIPHLILSICKLARRRFHGSIKFVLKKKDVKLSSPNLVKLKVRLSDNQILGFPAKRDWVFRIYGDEQQFALHKTGYNTLCKLYQLNQLQFLKGNTTKEKFIKGQNLRTLNAEIQNDVFEKIVQHYYHGLRTIEKSFLAPRIDAITFFDGIAKTAYPEELKNYILDRYHLFELILNNIHWIWCHSDLTIHNILYREGAYCIIDSERCESLPIIYDLVNLMLSYALLAKNEKPLKDFFMGRYDFLFVPFYSRIVGAEDRKNIFILLMALKSIIAWDATKMHDQLSHHQKWELIRHNIISNDCH